MQTMIIGIKALRVYSSTSFALFTHVAHLQDNTLRQRTGYAISMPQLRCCPGWAAPWLPKGTCRHPILCPFGLLRARLPLLTWGRCQALQQHGGARLAAQRHLALQLRHLRKCNHNLVPALLRTSTSLLLC